MENNMSKIIQATIVLVSGAILLGIGSFITPEQVKEVVISDFDFAVESIKETSTSSTFYYTTLKENTTTSEYELVREEHTITVDNVGKNMCLDGVFGTSTKEFCDEFQEKQLELNRKWFLEGETGRINMLKYK